MDDQPPLGILLWSGPSAIANILRTVRPFGEPKVPPMERLRWDYTHADDNWPGFLVYLEEKNYDTSKVVAVTWDPVEDIQDKNVILDGRVEVSEKCKRFNFYLCRKC